jgi:histidine triad (HIT) family protein
VSKTIFQKIIDREIPAKLAHEDEHCIAIPKQLIPRVGEAGPADQPVLGHLLLTAAALARKLGVAESGYRIVINNGANGGETVPHLHVHLLGNRPLAWPPG